MKTSEKELKKARRGYLLYFLLCMGLSAGLAAVYFLLPAPPQDGGLSIAFTGLPLEELQSSLMSMRAGMAFGGGTSALCIGAYYLWLVLHPEKCLEKFRKNYDERRQKGRERSGYMALNALLCVLLLLIMAATSIHWLFAALLWVVVMISLVLYGAFYLYYRWKY